MSAAALPAQRARTADLVSGALLLFLLVAHAWTKPAGTLPEMLWACHVATAIVAAGLLAGVPRLTAVGFLFHAGPGIVAYLIEIATARTTTATSALLHVLTPVLGALQVRRGGLPARVVLEAWLFNLAMIGVGRLAPEPLNVNVSWKPWLPLPALWQSHVVNAAISLALLAAARELLVRVGRFPAGFALRPPP